MSLSTSIIENLGVLRGRFCWLAVLRAEEHRYYASLSMLLWTRLGPDFLEITLDIYQFTTNYT